MMLPYGYGRRVGEAVLNNHVVSHLHFWQPSSCFDLSPQEMVEGQSPNFQYHPFLDWIGTSTAIRCVKLENTGGFYPFILSAVANNPNIEQLDALSSVSHDAFAFFLRTTRSVRTLGLHCEGGSSLVDTNHTLHVPSAFEANRTIETLSLSTAGFPNLDISDIIQALGAHTLLRKLKLQHTNPTVKYCRSVAHLLGSCQSLRTLTFATHKFDTTGMKIVVTALEACHSVTEIGLIHCTMDDGAAQSFVKFIQSKANKGFNVMRSLNLAGTSPNIVAKGFTSSSGTATTMLTGSSLENLALEDSRFDAVHFLRGLIANEPHIRLRRLQLSSLNCAEFEVLQEFLRRTGHLTELSIAQMSPMIPTRSLVKALRRNGSIRSVDIGGALWSPLERRLISAFGERNRVLPELLATTTHTIVDVSWIPTLLLVGQQAARMTPNATLIGLLHAASDVQP